MMACSENELGQISDKANSIKPGRAAELITQTIVLDSVGTLEAKLKEAMGDEVLSNLQKLVISGGFSAADWNFIRANLSGLEEIDLMDARIVGGGTVYYYNSPIKLQNDSVCNYMFHSANENLKRITLPVNLKYIGGWAFRGKKSLQYIEIPDSVKYIGTYAFADCSALDSIKLNEGLRTLNDCAFYRCSSLKRVVLPSTLYSFGADVFYGCNALQYVHIKSMTDLPGSTFTDCWNLKEVILPPELKSIGEHAFYNCSSLASIVLPDGLESIGYQAFYHCFSLKEITIPSSVTSIKERYTGYNYRNTFIGCTSLEKVVFKANVKSVPTAMFRDCSSLKTVELAEHVTTIGAYAFANCTSLADDKAFKHVTSLGEYAFNNCGFESFDLSHMTSISEDGLGECKKLKSVVLPGDLEVLPIGFLSNCTSLKTLELPNSLKTIADYAFSYSGLTSITIPESVTTIGQYAFRYTPLKELTIPASVTSVGNYFVDYCTDLVALYWNSSVEVPYNSSTKSCLVYLADESMSYNSSSWHNVVHNGVAELIELGYDGGANSPYRPSTSFACLKPFTAKKVVFKRTFDKQTVPGKSAGWQTITLPFTPDSIYHTAKGAIAPFNSEVKGAKPFWLRELKAEGFTDVTSIQPHTAYLIAMPNNSQYLDEYNLNGTIVFEAKNVEFGITPDTLKASVGPDFEFQPTYQKRDKAVGVYALNIDTRTYVDNVYTNGTAFTRNSEAVYTFEAFVKTLGGGRSSRTAFDIDGRSKHTRAIGQRNNTGIPQIGDM